MAKLYNYDSKTGEFLSQTTARPDPIDGTPLVPGNATLIAPPAAKTGKARVFQNGAWSQVDDHRGTAYWLADGTELVVEDLGPKPANALSAKPALPVYSDLEAARAAMVSWIDGFMAQITGKVPDYERASWPTKADAARAFIDGSARPDQTALIAAEASTSNQTNADVANKIAARANAYQTIIGEATGLRITLEAALEAATDPFEYETILANGKVQAATLATAHGITVT